MIDGVLMRSAREGFGCDFGSGCDCDCDCDCLFARMARMAREKKTLRR